jgi:L-iditol 2-dehydrogenase
MTNLSAVLYGEKDLRIEDRPLPTPGAGEVVVKVMAVGICGSDIHYFDHGRIGRYVVESPMILGHESAGEIVAVGEDVDSARIGARVALEPGVPDLTCEQCLAGRYNLCPAVQFFATPPVDGSITQYVTIRSSFAHPVPDGLSFDRAAMAEPVSVGVWASRKADVNAGDCVLVTGAGPIGLLVAQVARANGAVDMVITDISDYRLGIARELGFVTQSAKEPLEREFDVLLECSGAAAAIQAGLSALAPAGRAVLVGSGADTVALDIPLLQTRELQLAGVFRYANTYPTALGLIASHRIDVDSVMTHHFGINDTERALTLARDNPASLKGVVHPQELTIEESTP